MTARVCESPGKNSAKRTRLIDDFAKILIKFFGFFFFFTLKPLALLRAIINNVIILKKKTKMKFPAKYYDDGVSNIILYIVGVHSKGDN